MMREFRCDRPSSSGCHVGPLEEALALARRRAFRVLRSGRVCRRAPLRDGGG